MIWGWTRHRLNLPETAASRPWKSPLDHPDRPEPRDLLGDPGLVHHVDHMVDVLVSGGLLLGETFEAPGPGDNPDGVEFLVDPATDREANRRRPGSSGEPAPWQVVPKDWVMLPGSPARTQLAVPMLPGMMTGWPMLW